MTTFLNWSDWQAFVAMGGYAPYVWGSFGMVGAAVVVELLTLRGRRQALRSTESDAPFGATPHEA